MYEIDFKKINSNECKTRFENIFLRNKQHEWNSKHFKMEKKYGKPQL